MTTERIEDLIDIIGEQTASAEATLSVKNARRLLEFADNPKQWYAMQLATDWRYRSELIKDAKRLLDSINSTTEKAFLLSYREVAKDAVEVTETEIRVKDLTKTAEAYLKSLRERNAEKVAGLANAALSSHTEAVRVINSLSTPDTLYETIKEKLPVMVEQGLTVEYSNGAKVNWAAYMEMDVRTTVHQEIGRQQVEAGAKADIVFYMCDSFGDCAKDHADYQGKLYYNAQSSISPEEQAYIDANGIQSMQEVMEGDPYLTTRPNCRHNFHMVPTDEVLKNGASDYAKELTRGDYDENNYLLSQEQRKDERMIRAWKRKAFATESLYKSTNDPDLNAKLESERSRVAYWQGQTRDLVRDNPGVLERQRDREQLRVVIRDLGVRYDYRVKDGQLEKK